MSKCFYVKKKKKIPTTHKQIDLTIYNRYFLKYLKFVLLPHPENNYLIDSSSIQKRLRLKEAFQMHLKNKGKQSGEHNPFGIVMKVPMGQNTIGSQGKG